MPTTYEYSNSLRHAADEYDRTRALLDRFPGSYRDIGRALESWMDELYGDDPEGLDRLISEQLQVDETGDPAHPLHIEVAYDHLFWVVSETAWMNPDDMADAGLELPEGY